VEVQISEKENGYLVQIETEKKIALAIQSDQGERIYLPGQGGSDSTYYNEDPNYLTETENGYAVIHSEKPQNLEVIS